jgi:hypothetical protein
VPDACSPSLPVSLSIEPFIRHSCPARSVPDPRSSDAAAVVVTSWPASPLL